MTQRYHDRPGTTPDRTGSSRQNRGERGRFGRLSLLAGTCGPPRGFVPDVSCPSPVFSGARRRDRRQHGRLRDRDARLDLRTGAVGHATAECRGLRTGQREPCPGGSAGGVSISAFGVAFEQTSVTAPAGKAFQIAFDNKDAGTPHNVAIHKDNASGDEVFKGEIVTGPVTTTYDVPGPGRGDLRVRVHRAPQHDRHAHGPVGSGRR